jgi:hypothetical protein
MQSDYDRFVSVLKKIVNDQSPREALDELDKQMNTNQLVLNSCHTIVHEIGHESYKKYKNFSKAMSFQNDICGSGYIHGVIESHFETVPDVEAEMRRICAPEDGRCLHGIGHGIMFSNSNDLPSSVALCDKFETNFAKIYCAEGVFMENFSTNSRIHTSLYLSLNDPFYPCADQKGLYKGVCYYYAPIFFLTTHNNDYEAGLHACAALDPPYISTCTKGMGSRIMKNNIAAPVTAESYCMRTTIDQIPYCIDGMVSYYILNFNSKQKTQALCDSLHDTNRRACQNAITSRQNFFN